MPRNWDIYQPLLAQFFPSKREFRRAPTNEDMSHRTRQSLVLAVIIVARRGVLSNVVPFAAVQQLERDGGRGLGAAQPFRDRSLGAGQRLLAVDLGQFGVPASAKAATEIGCGHCYS